MFVAAEGSDKQRAVGGAGQNKPVSPASGDQAAGWVVEGGHALAFASPKMPTCSANDVEPVGFCVVVMEPQYQPAGLVFELRACLLVFLLLVCGVVDGSIDEDRNVHTVGVVGEIGPNVVTVNNLLSIVG